MATAPPTDLDRALSRIESLTDELRLAKRDHAADMGALRARLLDAEADTQRQRDRYRIVARAVSPGSDISESREVAEAAADHRSVAERTLPLITAARAVLRDASAEHLKALRSALARVTGDKE